MATEVVARKKRCGRLLATVQKLQRLVEQSPEIKAGLHIHHLDASDPTNQRYLGLDCRRISGNRWRWAHVLLLDDRFAAEVSKRSVRADLGWAEASLPIVWYFDPAQMMSLTMPAEPCSDDAVEQVSPREISPS